jgi:hypothetical protein
MKLLPILKMLRRGAATFGDTLRSALELLAGAGVSLMTGRLAPKLPPEIAAKDALIICPSPLLNQQTINWKHRNDYVIAFLNSACMSPTYLTLKPERYFLIDPGFFQKLDDTPSMALAIATIEKTISRIVGVTEWPLTIFVPWHYQNSENARRLSGNSHVTICGIPTFKSIGRHRLIKRLGFRLGILSPVYQNVLSAAIFYGIKAGHPRVWLWGAHHTWLRDNAVDQKNRVLYAIRHTDNQIEGQPMFNADGTPRHLHVYLRLLATSFEQYHVLNDYANSLNKQIINVTEDSYIDAFERSIRISLFEPSSS